MIYTSDEKDKRTAELNAMIDYLKEELQNAKSEAKKERIKKRIQELEDEADELYFSPTSEDLEEMKYWI